MAFAIIYIFFKETEHFLNSSGFAVKIRQNNLQQFSCAELHVVKLCCNADGSGVFAAQVACFSKKKNLLKLGLTL